MRYTKDNAWKICFLPFLNNTHMTLAKSAIQMEVLSSQVFAITLLDCGIYLWTHYGTIPILMVTSILPLSLKLDPNPIASDHTLLKMSIQSIPTESTEIYAPSPVLPTNHYTHHCSKQVLPPQFPVYDTWPYQQTSHPQTSHSKRTYGKDKGRQTKHATTANTD